MELAAVSEPAVYNPEIVVRDHPNSSIRGSTNWDTENVCPGPDTNIASAADGRITQP
jgi:hypothetical protein